MNPSKTYHISLGRILITQGAEALLHDLGKTPTDFLKRHQRGDWGDLDEHDQQVNQEAIEHGSRVMSAYETSGGRLWIITEHDRSITTLLVPSEY